MPLDFTRIAGGESGQREAFEEFCCQIAHRLNSGRDFVRLDGAGGDGGVECYLISGDGGKLGWQAKYVFDVDALLSQSTKSLETALRIHPDLNRYVLCFPFNLKGRTGRHLPSTETDDEAFRAWVADKEMAAAEQGRELKIEWWSASRLSDLLLQVDPSGGMTRFFFNETFLSQEWFRNHLDRQIAHAKPRYTPELRIETDLWRWFQGFGLDAEWFGEANELLEEARRHIEDLSEHIRKEPLPGLSPGWPPELLGKANETVSSANEALDALSKMIFLRGQLGATPTAITDSAADLHALAEVLLQEVQNAYPDRQVDSPGFRQFMAEYQVQLPLANVDVTRGALSSFERLEGYLGDISGQLTSASALLLTGPGGVGKTHGVCDVAGRRLAQGALTCLAYGSQFAGDSEPWNRLREILGLSDIGREGLLAALDCAAEASGQPLLIIVDAINETRPRDFWAHWAAAVIEDIRPYSNLRMCFTCRSTFAPIYATALQGATAVEFHGFRGREMEAVSEFFAHYQIQPPLAPILAPQLLNPLFLRLLCTALRAEGENRVPSGWKGIFPVVQKILHESDRRFADDRGLVHSGRTIERSLVAIATAVANSGGTSLPWSHALSVLGDTAPGIEAQTLDWLAGDGLVDIDGVSGVHLGAEDTVRVSFERVGDFLVADALLGGIRSEAIRGATRNGGPLAWLFESAIAVEANAGLIGALSIMLREEYSMDTELPNLLIGTTGYEAVRRITVENLAWRDPASLDGRTHELLTDFFRSTDSMSLALDTALALAFEPSGVDAINWLSATFSSIPMATRDPFWCGYLHSDQDRQGPASRIVQAAFQLPLHDLDDAVVERWLVVLGWFTAASDRRVKDGATRALVAVLSIWPQQIPRLLERFITLDDDAVVERALLSTYGALLLSPQSDALTAVASILTTSVGTDPGRFTNAVIRDLFRVILELGEHHGQLEDGTSSIVVPWPVVSDWPLHPPSDEEMQGWMERYPGLVNSAAHDDFYYYSMACLEGWQEALPKPEMARWIVRCVVESFGYDEQSLRYDALMHSKYGPGRGHPTWAERIGKKYQWIAMFRLAGILSDHMERQREIYDPELLRTPLLLSSERQLDPTLTGLAKKQATALTAGEWLPVEFVLPDLEPANAGEWVTSEQDIPAIDSLINQGGIENQWTLLDARTQWSLPLEKRRDHRPPVSPQVSIDLSGFLVRADYAHAVFAVLAEDRLFRGNNPEGAEWGHCFAGEYQFGTVFNTEPDAYHSAGGDGRQLPHPVYPVANSLIAEWEYDATAEGNRYFAVPSKQFFVDADLLWNGIDGFVRTDGKLVFRDPSLIRGGRKALMAETNDLLARLRHLGFSLVWTMEGEKLCFDAKSDIIARHCFSQSALLAEDGRLSVGPLRTFGRP